MQQKWDHIDEIIFESNPDININDNYNDKLLRKLAKTEKRATNSNVNITAASFILTGLLFLCIYIFNFQYKLLDMQLKLQSNLIYIQSEYSVNFKHFLGE